ncbi:MAG: nitroreductase [Firmicutes bacterium]|nr:nitroreductase [Bacillota bacterium]
MDVKTAIESRRSIRKYKPDAVSEELVKELLEAARLAPSGTNHQPWRFIVIRDRSVKEKIQAAAFDQEYLSQAPVLLVCCADLSTYGKDTRKRVEELIAVGAMDPASLDTYPGLNKPKDAEALKGYIPHAMLNVALAMENISLRATSLGLGTCIVQLMKAKKIAEVLALPDNLIITALMPVGYPEQSPAPRPRLALEEIIYQVI